MKEPVHRYWKYATILFAVLTVQLSVQTYQLQKVLDDVYSYSFDVSIYDIDTNKDIDSGMSVGGDSTSSDDPMKMHASYRGKQGGGMRIHGASYRPREWTIGCEGYISETILIDANSEDQFRVGLKKKPVKESPATQ